MSFYYESAADSEYEHEHCEDLIERWKARTEQAEKRINEFKTRVNDLLEDKQALQKQLEQAEKQLAEVRAELHDAYTTIPKVEQLKAELAAKDAELMEALQENRRLSEASQSIVALLHADVAAKDARIKELTILLNMGKN